MKEQVCLMVFAPGLLPILADMLWYLTGNAVPQAAIWWLGRGSGMAG
jgi:hypothetical protein